MHRRFGHCGSVAAIMTLGLLTWNCGSAGGDVANHDSVGETDQAVTTEFTKHGNNGTVSCDTFCAGSQWGPVGTCVGASAPDFPCNQAPGFLNAQLTCECVDPYGQPFEKDGDNGTASCSTFCRKAS